MEHAPPLALEELAAGQAPVEDKIRAFWLGHLIGRIATTEHEVAIDPPPFVARWRENPADPAHWLPALEDPARVISWLDQIEGALAARDRTLVVTYLPEEGNPSQARLMAHIVGERMGSGTDPRSGYSWTWVPNHLKDTHGIIAPRSMITLFKSAASHALNVTPSGKHMRILAPEELKEGLRETSRRRVVEM
jgi:hypothetical protein